MKNEDVIKNVKNIQKNIPYKSIFDAYNVQESATSQVALIKSSYGALSSVGLQFQGLDALASQVALIKSSYGALSSVVAQFALMNEGINSMNQAYSSILKNIGIYSDIVNFASNFNYEALFEEYKKRFFDIYTEDLDLFIRNNNWILPKFSTKGFITSLNDARVNNQEIDQIFVNFFKEDNYRILSKYYDSWVIDNFMPESSSKIIYSAIKLILEDNGEKYCELIIPSLIAQIDNLISQVLLKNGYKKNNENQFLKINGETEVPKGNYKTLIKDFAGTIIDDWDDNHVKFLLDFLYTPNDGKNALKGGMMPFNRHNIMHGIEHDYGTFENVIRCFLIIDFLNDFLSDDKVSRLNDELKF